jgi:hypothetical protein
MIEQDKAKIQIMLDEAGKKFTELCYMQIRLQPEEEIKIARTNLIELYKEIAFDREMPTIDDTYKCVVANWVGSEGKGGVKGLAASVINSIQDKDIRRSASIRVLGIDPGRK